MGTKKSGKRKCPLGLSSFDLLGRNFSFEFPTFSRKLKTKAGSGLTLIISLVTTIATRGPLAAPHPQAERFCSKVDFPPLKHERKAVLRRNKPPLAQFKKRLKMSQLSCSTEQKQLLLRRDQLRLPNLAVIVSRGKTASEQGLEFDLVKGR